MQKRKVGKIIQKNTTTNITHDQQTHKRSTTMILNWKHDGETKTRISADLANKKVSIENFTDDILDRAFGVKERPSWEDFKGLLSDRCVSPDLADIRLYLEQIGVQSYDELEIISKTEGRMAEDHYSLEIEDQEER